MSYSIRWKTQRTRHELLKLKGQFALAKKAHSLLEEKYKVLAQEAQDIERTLLPFQEELKSKTENAFALLSETIISIGLRNVYTAAIATKPNDDVDLTWTTIKGISTPRLTSKTQKRNPIERGHDLKMSNYLLDRTAEAFENLVRLLVEVAELENFLRILEKEIEKTEIRVSALEKVLIPSLNSEIVTITNKLEEREREGHIIVKWVKEKGSETY